MKVYVITKGKYSDYHICGVATDKETAEKLRVLNTDKWDKADVEEFDTDDGVKDLEKYVPAFLVRYDADEDNCFAGRNRCSRDSLGVISENIGYSGPYFQEFIEHREGMTEEKAKKIFFDDLAKYRAEKEGLI